MANVNADFIHADGQMSEGTATVTGQSSSKNSAASYYASVRTAAARRRQNASTGTVESTGYANAGSVTPEMEGGPGTGCTAIDQCVVAELARAGGYIDDAAYQAAAGRTGISLREYSEGLYEAFIQAGGDPESEQALFLRSIADNPNYEGLMVDRVQQVNLAGGQATFLGISDGQGNGVIGVSTDISASSYCSVTGDYNADEQNLAAALTQMSEGYARFDVAGIGQGGDAAVIAAMQQNDDVTARMGQLVTVNGEGFPRKFVQNHAEDAERIASRTTNYRPASSAHGATDAASYLAGGGSAFVGAETFVPAADENASDASWMNWRVNEDGSFAEGGGSSGGSPNSSGSDSAGGGEDYSDDYPAGIGGGGGSSGGGGGGSSGGGGGGGSYDDAGESGGSGGSTGGGGGGGGSYDDSGTSEGSGGSTGGGGGGGGSYDDSDESGESGGSTGGGGGGGGSYDDSDESGESGGSTGGGGGGSYDDSGESGESGGSTGGGGGGGSYDDSGESGGSGGSSGGGGGGGSYDDSGESGGSGGSSGGGGSYDDYPGYSGGGGNSGSGGTGGGGGTGGSSGSGGNPTEIEYVSQPVLDCAADLIEIARQLSTLQSTMQSKLTAAGRVWTCDSSTSVRSEVQKAVQSVMTTSHDYMDNVAKRLCRTDENYKKAEEAIKDANESVSSAFA